jgi:hypothetical protein
MRPGINHRTESAVRARVHIDGGQL